jgi:ArsR family transcriptional regulator
MDSHQRMAEIMKALAHPVRLQILEVLHQGEECVCHLEAALGLRQAYVSQQLARLREAQLVTDRREGTNVFYSLRDDTGLVGQLLDMARAAAQAHAEAEGVTLDLPSPARIKIENCPCPKCQVELTETQKI